MSGGARPSLPQPRPTTSSCLLCFLEQAGALGRLEGFASFHGADFYGLPRNKVRDDGVPLVLIPSC